MTRSARLRDCVCTRDIVIFRAVDMEVWKDELASLADELSTNYLAPRKIWHLRGHGHASAFPSRVFGHVQHSCRHCWYHWFEEAGESWAGMSCVI